MSRRKRKIEKERISLLIKNAYLEVGVRRDSEDDPFNMYERVWLTVDTAEKGSQIFSDRYTQGHLTALQFSEYLISAGEWVKTEYTREKPESEPTPAA